MKEVADELRGEIAASAARLRALSEEQAAESRATGKWTRKEIVGHLIDSAFNNHQRFVRAPRVMRFEWPGYDQDQWVAANRYRERPWSELVDLWAAANGHLAHVIEGLSPGARRTLCVIGGEHGTLEWWVVDYLRHMRHHLAQIEEGEP